MAIYHHTLLTKINPRQATVAVFGPAKVEALNTGRSYLADVPTRGGIKRGQGRSPYGQTTTDYSLS